MGSVRVAGAMSTKLVVVLAAVMLLVAMLSRQFGRAGNGVGQNKKRRPAIEATRKCPTCGAYAMAGARCERADCPID